MSPLVLAVGSLATAGIALVWAGYEMMALSRSLSALEGRLMALEARQSRLQRVVERGWSQSLDLTSFDWSLDKPEDS